MSNIKIQTILGKIETVYGTDSTPGNANALLVEGLDITPLDMNPVSVDYALLGFSKEKSIPAEKMARVKFTSDFVPSGTVDVPPAYGFALRACGLQEAITAGVSVAYTPIAPAVEGASFYIWQSGTRHKLSGARGTFTLDAQPGKLPKLNFDFIGYYSTPTDVALPAPTYSNQAAPKPINKANTTFTVNAGSNVNLELNAFSFQLANSLVYRDRPHYESIDVDDRAPTGSLSVHQPALATFNAFSIAETPTMMSIDLLHTVAASRTARLTAPVSQLGKPAYGADGNKRLVTAPFDVRRNGAGADFTILFT